MARPQVVDGGTASSTEGSCEYINKQWWTADKEWSSSFRLGEVPTSSDRKNVSSYESFKKESICECCNELSVSIKCGEFLD